MTHSERTAPTAPRRTIVLSEECIFERGDKRLVRRRVYSFDPALGEPQETPAANAISIHYRGWSHFGHQFETELATFAVTPINALALDALIEQYCQGTIAYIGQEDICACLHRMSWAGEMGYVCPGSF
jgi:hypothetical protein